MSPTDPAPSPYRNPHDPRRRAARSPFARLASLWFGLHAPVGRRAYVTSGVGLMLFKYALDAAVVFIITGRAWTPLSYLAPSAVLRERALGAAASQPLYALMGVMTLPFLWIGVTMSVRRAADAGRSPWLGLAFLLPALNYLAMLTLAVLPSKEGGAGWAIDRDPPASARLDPGVKGALLGVLASVVEAVAMTALAVYGYGTYGAVLFLATPCVMGATSAFCYNHRRPRSLANTLIVALVGTAAAGGALLLFAIEGLLCLAMAFPLAAALACMGAAVGRAICIRGGTRQGGVTLAFMMLPSAAGAESALASPTLHEVETVIEIDAPPEVVWENVVGFSDLPSPPEWFFQLGIAYPRRATIEGAGVGAVRYCEFSTGPFVEPITRWEPPQRLSFDVRAQPPSMAEWSPYARVNAPHLEGYMVSRRGEFRLVRLPEGRTRLEGSTFYTLAVFPESYWTVYSDALVHAIHGRVLAHIKALSERPRT